MRGRSKRKHRWKLVFEGVVDSTKSVYRKWVCRRCGLSTTTWHEHPPSGTLLDPDGRDCASKIVTEVMTT